MITRGEIRRPTIHGLLPLGVLTGALLLTWGPSNSIEKIQDFQNQAAFKAIIMKGGK